MMPTPEEPINWPHVTIGGRLLTLRRTLLYQFKLNEWGGVQPITPHDGPPTPEDSVALSAKLLKIFAAAVAPCYSTARPPQAIPTPEEWAATINEDTEWPEVARAAWSFVQIVNELKNKKGLTIAPPAASPTQETTSPAPVQ